MFSPRTITSATRTGLYGTLLAFFSIRDPHTLELLDAAIVGLILADYGSWLVYSLIALPDEIWHGAYDAVINTLFGMFMFRNFKPDGVFEGEAIAVGFAVCLATLMIKVIFYASDYLREENDDL